VSDRETCATAAAGWRRKSRPVLFIATEIAAASKAGFSAGLAVPRAESADEAVMVPATRSTADVRQRRQEWSLFDRGITSSRLSSCLLDSSRGGRWRLVRHRSSGWWRSGLELSKADHLLSFRGSSRHQSSQRLRCGWFRGSGTRTAQCDLYADHEIRPAGTGTDAVLKKLTAEFMKFICALLMDLSPNM